MLDWDSWAAEEALRLLGRVRTRWDHTLGVVQRVESLRRAVGSDAEHRLLVGAAYLHDIGYASALSDTGLHALDGARHLRRAGAPETLCGLVAYHSCSWIEAEVRGIPGPQPEFTAPPQPLLDALDYADMTTGADGREMVFETRMHEIFQRYPAGAVREANERGEPLLRAAVRRVQERLEASDR